MSEISSTEIRYDFAIYKITLSDGYCYVGSTNNFRDRIRRHLRDCYNSKSISYNKPLYKYIRHNNLNFDRTCFTVLEQVENYTKIEALKIEEKYRKEFEVLVGGNILNDRRAYITEDEKKEEIEEYNRVYYQNNKEKILEQNKVYRQNNKEKITEQNKVYYQNNKEKLTEYNRVYYQTNKEKISERKKVWDKEPWHCIICNVTITKCNKARHCRSQKHLNNLSK